MILFVVRNLFFLIRERISPNHGQGNCLVVSWPGSSLEKSFVDHVNLLKFGEESVKRKSLLKADNLFI